MPTKAMPKNCLPIVLFCVLIAACVAVPVQEMSDARQAIRSATAVGANTDNSAAMGDAEVLMSQAEKALESRHYRDARRMALEAKIKAISARTLVQQEAVYPLPTRVE